MFVRKEEDLLNAKLVFFILFKPIGTMAHYSVYVLNRYCGSIDILDSLPYSNKGTSRTSFHGDCQHIIKRFVGLLEEMYGKAVYKASKQPNWFFSTYDGDELVDDFGDVEATANDWKAEFMHTLIFSEKNEVMRAELPKEIQSLGP
ncbi:hypothetical protein VPH35_014011 [Triticum aestivum]